MRSTKFDEKSAENWRRKELPSRRKRASITEQTATHKYTSIHSTSALKATAAAAQCRTKETFSGQTDRDMCRCSFVLCGKTRLFLSLLDKLSSSVWNFGQLELSGERKWEERESFSGLLPSRGSILLGGLVVKFYPWVTDTSSMKDSETGENRTLFLHCSWGNPLDPSARKSRV